MEGTDMTHEAELLRVSGWKDAAHPERGEWGFSVREPGVVNIEGPVQGRVAWDGWSLRFQDSSREATLQQVQVPEGLRSLIEQQLARSHHRGLVFDSPAMESAREVAKASLALHGVRPETVECDAFRNRMALDSHGPLATVGVWMSSPNLQDRRLVLTSSVLDALAHYQANPSNHVRYLAVPSREGPDAPMTQRQRLAVARFVASMPAGTQVVLAFGRDALGERRCEEMRALAPGLQLQQHQPARGRSWAEALRRSERDFIREQAPPRARAAAALER